MQPVSNAYKASMQSRLRNHGYIRITIGVVNQVAQENAEITDTDLLYLSDNNGLFYGEPVTRIYATAEEDFTLLNGSRYFAPSESSLLDLYKNGAISEDLLGAIKISFNAQYDLDIKGFTIDFGDFYPTEFTITTDTKTVTYENDRRYFSTEDTFNGISYVLITPVTMVNGSGRLRIYSFSCGISNQFSDTNVVDYSGKEYVSSVCDSLPSMDMSITVANYDQYYSPDNADSALSYMEVGQPVVVQFGYDVTGSGDIEWLPSTTAHLKTWSANDTQAKFTAVDRFEYELNGTYNKGKYYPSGISLYDLAELVLADAGITNDEEEEYFLDPYLKNILVYNPLPPVKHSECLQIIANAARCCLFVDRKDRIHINGNFVPDTVVTTNGETAYSNASNLVDGQNRTGYAEASKDFSLVNGSLYFLPSDSGIYFVTNGFVSSAVADENGEFTANPVVTVTLEDAYVYYGLQIDFRNVPATEFILRQYYNGNLVKSETVENDSLHWMSLNASELFDTLEIEITKGSPLSRVFIDNIRFGDVTDYTLSREYSMTGSPSVERVNRLQSVSVAKHVYGSSTEDIKNLSTDTVTVEAGDQVTVDFTNPSYGYVVSITSSNPSGYTATIVDSGAYFATIEFGGMSEAVDIEINVDGYEYVVSDSTVRKTYHSSGEIIDWDNPLISTDALAKDLVEWIGDYYSGDVLYSVPWRGDPRVDANDLFFMELKTGETTIIRSYQNEMKYNGAWSGTIKGRRAYLEGE